MQLAAVDGISGCGCNFARSHVLDAALTASSANRYGANGLLPGKAAIGNAANDRRADCSLCTCAGRCSGLVKYIRIKQSAWRGSSAPCCLAVITQIHGIGNGVAQTCTRRGGIDAATQHICIGRGNVVVIAYDAAIFRRCRHPVEVAERTGILGCDRICRRSVIVTDGVRTRAGNVGTIAQCTRIGTGNHIAHTDGNSIFRRRLRPLAYSERTLTSCMGIGTNGNGLVIQCFCCATNGNRTCHLGNGIGTNSNIGFAITGSPLTHHHRLRTITIGGVGYACSGITTHHALGSRIIKTAII